MRLNRIAIVLLAALGLAMPLPAPSVHAQEAGAEMPPMPRPRPDREGTRDTPAPPAPASLATQAIETLTGAAQPVTLSATIATGGAQIPAGLVWRVFDTTPDVSGELTLVARSEEPVANVALEPGDYVVHVAYGRAQTSDTVTVTGPKAVTMAIEAGALRLGAAVTGEIAIPSNLLRFDVYAGGQNERNRIVEALGPDQTVTLNAGTYHVVSHFGNVNAVVRADLRVEPGQLTEATLYHNASQVSFRLVSEPGGEAIADVEWTVRDPSGTVLFTEHSAFPAAVLSAGDYIVLAKQGQSVFNREFEVQPGSPREIEVLTQVY